MKIFRATVDSFIIIRRGNIKGGGLKQKVGAQKFHLPVTKNFSK